MVDFRQLFNKIQFAFDSALKAFGIEVMFAVSAVVVAYSNSWVRATSNSDIYLEDPGCA